MAVYKVSSKDGTDRYVEARTQQQAINHVVSDKFTATTLAMKDVTKLAREGKVIEEAKPDAVTAEAPNPEKSADVAGISSAQAGIANEVTASVDATSATTKKSLFTKKSA